MAYVSKIFSTGLERRLPEPFEGLDINFCRNPDCGSFGVHPDPFKRVSGDPTAPPGALRGAVKGGRHSENFLCPTCGKSSRLKNNRAVVEEYTRLKNLQVTDPTAPSCGNTDCLAHGMPLETYPSFYRKFGTTAKGDPRWQCRLCKKTLSVGKPARRQRRSEKNRTLFQMLCNDVSLSKISKIEDISARDLYGKIDFFYDRVRAFTAERQDFALVDFEEVGSRFATDSQTLMINWPTKRERTSVAVQHLCTAHHNSGFIMEAAIQFDPSITMDEAEERVFQAGEDAVSMAFRTHGRVWTKTEFGRYLAKLQKQKRAKTTSLYQLPHKGALVRYDILQLAHALRLREILSATDAPLYFVMDADMGLQQAFTSIFADGILDGRVDLATIMFHKGMTNDARNAAVAAGQTDLSAATGQSLAHLRALSDEDYADLVDTELAVRLIGHQLGRPFQFPFPRKSEPDKVVRILTDRASRSYHSRGKVIRRATLRSVDAYFHKFRSNIRAAARPGSTPSSGGKTWNKHYFYKPEMMHKIAEIYRFYHNWVDRGDDRQTPAMRIGLAKGRIYERDFM